MTAMPDGMGLRVLSTEEEGCFREVLTAQLSKLRDCLMDEHEKQINKVSRAAFLTAPGRSKKSKSNEFGGVQSENISSFARAKSQAVPARDFEKQDVPRMDMREHIERSSSSMPLTSFLPRRKSNSKARGKSDYSMPMNVQTFSPNSVSSVLPSTGNLMMHSSPTPSSSSKHRPAENRELPGLVNDTEEEEAQNSPDDVLDASDVPLPPTLHEPPPPQRPPVALIDPSSASVTSGASSAREDANGDEFNAHTPSFETTFSPWEGSRSHERRVTRRRSTKTKLRLHIDRKRRGSVTTNDSSSMARLLDTPTAGSDWSADGGDDPKSVHELEDEVSEMSSESESDDDKEFRVLICWQRRHKSRRTTNSALTNPCLQVTLECGKESLYHKLGSWSTGPLEAPKDEPKLLKCLRFLAFSKVPPSAYFNFVWEMFMLLFLIYDVFTIPLELFILPELVFISVMSWVVCIFWTVHIVKTFRTGYISVDGTVEMKDSCIARRYLQTWLVLDSTCTIIDWITLIKVSMNEWGHMDVADGVLMMPRMLRSVRLARLLRASDVEGFITEHLRSETAGVVASVAKIIVLLVALAHVIACVWYFIGYHMDEGTDRRRLGWVRSAGMQSASFWEKYVCSLNWALAQFVGENILDLHTARERLFNIFVILFAFLFSSLFVSSITTLMTRVQMDSMKHASQYRALRRYLIDNNISTSLAVRVQRNAFHAVKRHVQSETDIELLKVISEPLRVELHFEAYAPIAMRHPFVKNYSLLDPSGVRKVCHIAFSIVSISRGDVVFSNMETPVWPRMFFFVAGRLKYFQDQRDDVTLRRGAWACEPVLWTHWMHCGTLCAATDCALLHLDAAKFQMIVSAWPGDHVKQYAEAFVAGLNATDGYNMSDLKTDAVAEGTTMAFPDFQTDDDQGPLFERCETVRSNGSMTASQDFTTKYSAVFSYASSFRRVISAKFTGQFSSDTKNSIVS